MKKTIFIFALMILILSFGVLGAMQNYVVNAKAVDFDTNEEVYPTTITIDGIENLANPIATFDSLPSRSLYFVDFNNDDYLYFGFDVYFDQNLDSLTGQESDYFVTMEGNSKFETTCTLNPNLEFDYVCDYTNSGVTERFHYDYMTKEITLIGAIVAKDVPSTRPVINKYESSTASGEAPLNVEFYFDIEDDEGINEVTLYFGDFTSHKVDVGGAEGYEEIVSHTYNTPGTYTAKLAVMDTRGLFVRQEIEIEVEEEEQLEEEHLIEVTEIILDPESGITSGDLLTVQVRVENAGESVEDDIKITAEVLGLESAMDSLYLMSELEPGDEALSEPLNFYIPLETETGEYTLEVSVEYDNGDEITTAQKPIIIFEPGQTSVKVIQPNGGEILQGDYEIQWIANDGESEQVIDIFIQEEGDWLWELIASGIDNNGNYMWNTSDVRDDDEYLIMIVAREPTTSIFDLVFEYFELILLGDYDVSDDTFAINNYNEEPCAHADVLPDDRVEVGTEVFLDASNSHDNDPGDEIESYEWYQSSGPSVQLNNYDQAIASFTPEVAGLYKFCVQVSDGELGDTSCTSVRVISLEPEIEEVQLEERDIFINRVRTNDNKVYFKPGDEINIGITLSNYRQDNIDEAKVHLLIPKLGFMKEFGPFELEEDNLVTKEARFRVPSNAKPGTYEMRTIITTEADQRTSIRRIKII